MNTFRYIIYLLLSVILFLAISFGAINLYYYLASFIQNTYLLILAILIGTFFYVELVNLIATIPFLLFKSLNNYGKNGILIATAIVLIIGISFIIIQFINSNFGHKNSILYFIGFLFTYGGIIGKYTKLLNIDDEMKKHSEFR